MRVGGQNAALNVIRRGDESRVREIVKLLEGYGVLIFQRWSTTAANPLATRRLRSHVTASHGSNQRNRLSFPQGKANRLPLAIAIHIEDKFSDAYKEEAANMLRETPDGIDGIVFGAALLGRA